MFTDKILIIIPARIGSKGIPQKNVRFIAGKPLIYYAIDNAIKLRADFDNVDIYVSSDSEEIEDLATHYNCNFLKREGYLAGDNATIDEVIYSDYSRINLHYDFIVTLQPSSPLLKYKTLKQAMLNFIQSDSDAVISCIEDSHLSWSKNENIFVPEYKERLNRQQLPPSYKETGAFVICKSEILINNKTRISGKIDLALISPEESIDIDTKNDWILCQSIFKRRKVGFVVIGNYEIGMGHIHRAITLENYLSNDECTFYIKSNSDLGTDKISSLNYKYKIFQSYDKLVDLLIEDNVDIVINDILDIDCDYMHRLKKENFYVVNFENNSSCELKANLSFNALYEFTGNEESYFYGYKYEVLREDIYLFPIKKHFNNENLTVTVSFGGTDINNASMLVLDYLFKYKDNLNIILILGIGFKFEKEINDYLNVNKFESLTIVNDVKFMAHYINNSDFIISGNGRMVYEVVSMAVPLLVISQNEREATHTFSKHCNGIVYLGQYDRMDSLLFDKTVKSFIDNPKQLLIFSHKLRKYALEIRRGVDTIVKKINLSYDEFNE